MTANFEFLRNIIAMQLTFEAWRPTSHRQLDKQTLFGVVARPGIKKKYNFSVQCKKIPSNIIRASLIVWQTAAYWAQNLQLPST